MKKPKYIEELLKIIFSWLGAAFLCFGILGYIGVLQPTASSRIQDPALLGYCFGMIGIVFITVGFSLGIIVIRKKELHSELLTNGTRITGVVEKVYLQKYTQYGNESPYRIQYVYTYLGNEYHRKSSILWKKPDLMEGNAISVYVYDSGKSTLSLEN